ncbi:hypothetical protein ES703_24655 [subsurface metagenome]
MVLSLLAVAVMLLAGCAPLGAASPTAQSSGPGIGTIQVRVTDALPEYIIEAVNVSFTEVKVHWAADEQDGEGEWKILNITGGTFGNDGSFDLKELGEAGKLELLAEDEVLAGWYTQLRLTVTQVDVTYTELENQNNGETESTTVRAKLPSGKLKFVRPFQVIDGGTTTIDLDFDLDKSVVFTGATKYNEDTEQNERKVIVKPVVKLAITYGEDTTPPAQVTTLTVTPDQENSDQLNLAWVANTAPDLAHYNVYRGTASGFTPDAGNLIDLPTSNSYSDTGLAPGTYYYKVTAIDTSDNEGLVSEEASGTVS